MPRLYIAITKDREHTRPGRGSSGHQAVATYHVRLATGALDWSDKPVPNREFICEWAEFDLSILPFPEEMLSSSVGRLLVPKISDWESALLEHVELRVNPLEEDLGEGPPGEVRAVRLRPILMSASMGPGGQRRG